MAKYILPALALVGTAFAQCDGPSITIRSSDDASGIQNCQRYNGDVIIDESVSGTISLEGVQNIQGDFICNNATNLNSITSSTLTTISGKFGLNGLIVLSTLQFDRLNGVNQIEWINLPALQSLNFRTGISKANNVYISNTQLNNLAGIELSQVGTMDVNNNPYLDTINVNSLTNVTQSLSFSANGRELDISFPNLEGAANLTFRNVSSVQMPSLAEVPGAMGFYSDMFQNFSAPNLTRIGQSLAFVDCPQLATLDLPQLELIGGGFILGNNSELESITGVGSLARVGGAIDFAGTFSSVAMPSLSDVRGGANVQTTSNNGTICDLFNTARSKGAIKGNVKCSTSVQNPQNNGSSTGSSSSSSNAAVHAGFDPAAPLTGVFGLIAALLFL